MLQYYVLQSSYLTFFNIYSANYKRVKAIHKNDNLTSGSEILTESE